jgi:hypothetical protein
MSSIGLVFSIHDPTEVAIQKMMEANQRMLKMNSQGEKEGELGGGMNPNPFLDRKRK